MNARSYVNTKTLQYITIEEKKTTKTITSKKNRKREEKTELRKRYVCRHKLPLFYVIMNESHQNEKLIAFK